MAPLHGLSASRVPFRPLEVACGTFSESPRGISGAVNNGLTSSGSSSQQASGPRKGAGNAHRPSFPGPIPAILLLGPFPLCLSLVFSRAFSLNVSHFRFTKCLRPLGGQQPRQPESLIQSLAPPSASPPPASTRADSPRARPGRHVSLASPRPLPSREPPAPPRPRAGALRRALELTLPRRPACGDGLAAAAAV